VKAHYRFKTVRYELQKSYAGKKDIGPTCEFTASPKVGFKPRLPAWEGSCAAARPAAPDPASLCERAPVLPHVS
jgi:hypothetical protein